MKELGYLLFALVFNISRIFPLNTNKVLLFNGHNRGLNGNLLEIKRVILQNRPGTKFLFYAKRDLSASEGISGKLMGALRFFIVLPYHMATAGRVFLNDNFLPLGKCHPSQRAQFVQLWHGAGAFKKFGLSVEDDEKVCRLVKRANLRITHLFVTSQKVVPYYQEAFALPANRIYPAGVPIVDIYSQEKQQYMAKERFYSCYPQLRDKRLLLYTPTFRGTEQENADLMKQFPIKPLQKQLGQEWVILIKLHPKYARYTVEENEYCYDVTEYAQTADLFFVSDELVTDYSSTVVEYSLLDKPIVLYAFDLEKYDRGFYRDYETTAPGIIAHNQKELLQAVGQEQKDSLRRREFVRMQYDQADGRASERIFDILYAQKEV